MTTASRGSEKPTTGALAEQAQAARRPPGPAVPIAVTRAAGVTYARPEVDEGESCRGVRSVRGPSVPGERRRAGSRRPARPGQKRVNDLWTCPACGRGFANRNQSHACGRHSLEAHFAGKPPQIRSLFDAFYPHGPFYTVVSAG